MRHGPLTHPDKILRDSRSPFIIKEPRPAIGMRNHHPKEIHIRSTKLAQKILQPLQILLHLLQCHLNPLLQGPSPSWHRRIPSDFFTSPIPQVMIIPLIQRLDHIPPQTMNARADQRPLLLRISVQIAVRRRHAIDVLGDGFEADDFAHRSTGRIVEEEHGEFTRVVLFPDEGGQDLVFELDVDEAGADADTAAFVDEVADCQAGSGVAIEDVEFGVAAVGDGWCWWGV